MCSGPQAIPARLSLSSKGTPSKHPARHCRGRATESACVLLPGNGVADRSRHTARSAMRSFSAIVNAVLEEGRVGSHVSRAARHGIAGPRVNPELAYRRMLLPPAARRRWQGSVSGPAIR
jgi:hypothetical protein